MWGDVELAHCIRGDRVKYGKSAACTSATGGDPDDTNDPKSSKPKPKPKK